MVSNSTTTVGVILEGIRTMSPKSFSQDLTCNFEDNRCSSGLIIAKRGEVYVVAGDAVVGTNTLVGTEEGENAKSIISITLKELMERACPKWLATHRHIWLKCKDLKGAL